MNYFPGLPIKSLSYPSIPNRPSGQRLCNALQRGLKVLDSVEARDLADKTTPQLHYFVRCLNDADYGDASEVGYHTKMAEAYKIIVVRSMSVIHSQLKL